MSTPAAESVRPDTEPQRDGRVVALRSYGRGLAAFVADAVVLTTLIWFALTKDAWWLQLLCAVLAGLMIGVLFVVGHDAAHNSLTPSAMLNRLLGRIAFLPSLHAFSLWVRAHNGTHHRWTNLAPKDYVWSPLALREYRALSRGRRLLYRFYRSVWGPLAYYPLEIWCKRLLFPTRRELGRIERRHVLDSALVVTFALSYLALLMFGNRAGWWGGPRALWNPLLFGALVPFCVWNWLMGFVIYLQHTHPSLVWYQDEAHWRRAAVQAELAVHVVFPGPINRVFHWIMEHNAHHARMALPFHQLPREQDALESDASLEITRVEWTPSAHMDVVRRCKLFDFEAGRWLSFEGEHTS